MDPYYEPQFEQAPVHQIAWKKIAVIVGVAIAVVIVVAVIIRAWPENEAKKNAQATVELARRASANCEGEKCVNAKVREVARVSGVVEACALLAEGEAQDNCVWTTARTRNNAEFCELIEKKEWAEKCKDGIIFTTAKAKGDSNACYDIKDARLQKTCLSELMGAVTSANCTVRGFDAAHCADVAVTEQARIKRDPDVCEQIQDEAQMENCLERTGPADRDRDGLSEGEEQLYGSSDANADSDGDGFKDGEEVRAGYNPAGSGTL